MFILAIICKIRGDSKCLLRLGEAVHVQALETLEERLNI